MKDFHFDSRIVELEAAVSAGQTTIESEVVDCAALEAVTFLVAFGAITAGGTCPVQVHGDDESDGSFTQALDQNGDQIKYTTADTDDNKLVKLTVRKTSYRYLRVEIPRATQDSAVRGIWAILHPSAKPATQTSTNIIDGGLWLAAE